MHETTRMALVNQFKDRLKEGSVVTLEGYNLGEIQPKFRMVNKALRLSFLTSTKVEPCPDFSGSFSDVIGHVTACENLNMYDKNDKSGKKKPLALVDHEGNELQCTLWSAFAQQFNDFLKTCADHGKIILGGEEFQDVKEYNSRLFAREDVENQKIRQHVYLRPLKTLPRKVLSVRFLQGTSLNCWMSHRALLQLLWAQ
nr:replication protein A 70 kDa DNA-binding subunit B [Tanacetum cinerariifolium]